MSVQVFWFLPTHGDSRYLGSGEGARTVDLAYLQQVAGAADRLGYEGVLIPTGRSCEDPWVIASSLIGATQRLKFLVAVRPGLHCAPAAHSFMGTLKQGAVRVCPSAFSNINEIDRFILDMMKIRAK